MHNSHSRNGVRYYILLIALLAFLFFSNDFGLIDVQKTAIVMAVGIDREEDGFSVTSQIALPQSSDQGSSSQAIQLVSKGKTVAEALEEINAKTGWYPKLVFCRLILLGESAAKENVFDALDFFLRDEYLTDDCLLATCEGSAKELLDVSALVDPSSSMAMGKVLSAHAERVGTVHPVTLKDFSIGYFGDSQSGLMPILKKEEQQEAQTTATQSGQESGQGGTSGKSGGDAQKQKPIFSAKETALFVGGRLREKLTAEETFALNAAIGKLQLASYSVEVGGQTCTLTIKRNLPKIGLDIGKDGRGVVKVEIGMVAGAADYSKAQGIQEIKDIGDPPNGVFAAAEKKLAATLSSAYEKAKGVGCDVFSLQERLVKYKRRRYFQHKDEVLNNTTISAKIRFQRVR